MIEFIPDSQFQIKGRGTIFTADTTTQPQIVNIQTGDVVVCQGKTYEIRGIELARGLTLSPKRGFLVKEITL